MYVFVFFCLLVQCSLSIGTRFLFVILSFTQIDYGFTSSGPALRRPDRRGHQRCYI